MDKIYLVKVKNNEEFCTLKFLLYARNFENIGAYYVNKPVIINFSTKQFDNIELENLDTIKNKFNLKEISLNEFKHSLIKKNNELEN